MAPRQCLTGLVDGVNRSLDSGLIRLTRAHLSGDGQEAAQFLEKSALVLGDSHSDIVMIESVPVIRSAHASTITACGVER